VFWEYTSWQNRAAGFVDLIFWAGERRSEGEGVREEYSEDIRPECDEREGARGRAAENRFVKLFLSDLGGGLGASLLPSKDDGDSERLRRGSSRTAVRLPESPSKGCIS